MALTLTNTVTDRPLSGNLHLLNILMSGAGDGSGGDVSGTVDLSTYLPRNVEIWLLAVNASQQDAINNACYAYLGSTFSHHTYPNNILMSPLTEAGTTYYRQYANTYWQTTLQDIAVPLPLYLGSPIVSTNVTIGAKFATNTNTKMYMFAWKLLYRLIN